MTTKKKIYSADYVFQIEYETGFWKWKKKEIENFKYEDDFYILEEDADKALERFKELDMWQLKSIPHWLEVFFGIDSLKYVYKGKRIEVSSIDPPLKTLRNKMRSSEFLEYCKQELFDVSDVMIK